MFQYVKFSLICNNSIIAIHIFTVWSKIDRENIDKFDEFSAIRQYFPHQNFPFYYRPLMIFLPVATHNEVTVHEAP